MKGGITRRREERNGEEKRKEEEGTGVDEIVGEQDLRSE
jgi:hypothetical protein